MVQLPKMRSDFIRKEQHMTPITLEVVAPMLSGVDMSCRGCGLIFDTLGLKRQNQKSAIDEYPEEWKEAGAYLSDWIKQVSSLYKHRIRIRLIDAQSPLGLWKQIRHRVFRFPAFIVNKKWTYVGWDPKDLEALLDDHILDGIAS